MSQCCWTMRTLAIGSLSHDERERPRSGRHLKWSCLSWFIMRWMSITSLFLSPIIFGWMGVVCFSGWYANDSRLWCKLLFGMLAGIVAIFGCYDMKLFVWSLRLRLWRWLQFGHFLTRYENWRAHKWPCHICIVALLLQVVFKFENGWLNEFATVQSDRAEVRNVVEQQYETSEALPPAFWYCQTYPAGLCVLFGYLANFCTSLWQPEMPSQRALVEEEKKNVNESRRKP